MLPENREHLRLIIHDPSKILPRYNTQTRNATCQSKPKIPKLLCRHLYTALAKVKEVIAIISWMFALLTTVLYLLEKVKLAVIRVMLIICYPSALRTIYPTITRSSPSLSLHLI